jgi:hypothetical protein
MEGSLTIELKTRRSCKLQGKRELGVGTTHGLKQAELLQG